MVPSDPCLLYSHDCVILLYGLVEYWNVIGVMILTFLGLGYKRYCGSVLVVPVSLSLFLCLSNLDFWDAALS